MVEKTTAIQESMDMKIRLKQYHVAPLALASLVLAMQACQPKIAGPAAAGDGGIDEFGMEDHSATCKWDINYQNISVADFNGNGMVDPADIAELTAAISAYNNDPRKNYQAFYDIVNPVVPGSTNGTTENKLDGADLAAANSDMMFAMFSGPSGLDRQVAAQYQFTKRYRDINQAILDGFVPFTQEYHNHGIHLLKFPTKDANGNWVGNVIDGKFDAAKPEGLNYDRYGNLVGVFYALGPDLMRLMAGDREHFNDWLKGDYEKLLNEVDATGAKVNDLQVVTMGGKRMIRPRGFAPDGNGNEQDMWHFHQGMCERNLWTVYEQFQTQLRPKAEKGTLTFAEVLEVSQGMDTRQCDIEKPCNNFMSQQPGPNGPYPDAFYIPRFFMLHTWIYNANNRCGTMWGSHEDVSYNDLNPDGLLTPAEEIALRNSIPTESQSFVFQPATALLPDGTENKNYRKVCLNTNFLTKIENYEQGRAILRGEDVVINGVTENYQTMGFTATEIQDVLICQPKISGEPLDSRCAKHPNDL